MSVLQLQPHNRITLTVLQSRITSKPQDRKTLQPYNLDNRMTR